jgi:hypothetical protein
MSPGIILHIHKFIPDPMEAISARLGQSAIQDVSIASEDVQNALTSEA